jgi:hypothetical protein
VDCKYFEKNVYKISNGDKEERVLSETTAIGTYNHSHLFKQAPIKTCHCGIYNCKQTKSY